MKKSMIEIIGMIAEVFESGDMAVKQRENGWSDKWRWGMSMAEVAFSDDRVLVTTDLTDNFIDDTWAAYQKICLIEHPKGYGL